MNRFKLFYRAMIDEYRAKKSTFIIYITLRAVVLFIAVLMILGKNYNGAFLCVLTLMLFLIPAAVQTKFNVALPTTLEIIVLFFIFAAEILGELADYYVRFPIWDTVLHITTGFLAAAVGLSLIDLLNRSERFKFELSPLFVALVSFCFSMTIGVLWEFFEFFADVLLATDMQKDTIVQHISSVLLNQSGKNDPVLIENITKTAINGVPLPIDGYLDIGLYDTMKDLTVNFIGAVVFSVFGYFYTKFQGKGKAARIVEKFKWSKKTSRFKA